MEGEGEIVDGGWGKGFGSEMEGKEKVKIGDGGWGEVFWSEMEGKREDGGWSGSSEGDRVQNVSKENKRKKNEGIAQKKLKTNVLWLRVLNAAVAPSKKNADIAVKNAALDLG